jgi:hypothetical protein
MKYYSDMTEEQKKAHLVYIKALRDMGPERRLQRAFDLSDFTRQLFLTGLRQANPTLSRRRTPPALFETHRFMPQQELVKLASCQYR